MVRGAVWGCAVRRAELIVDCHCHAGTGDGLTGPWDTRAPLDQYLRRADAAGIDRTVLFAPFHSDYALANREVAGIVRSLAEEVPRFRGRPPVVTTVAGWPS